MAFIVTSFYRFFDFPHFKDVRLPLQKELTRLDIKGSVLLAPEGINGTLSGSRDAIDAISAYLQNEIVHGDIEFKESHFERRPFGRAKVRLKKEIITFGQKTDTGRTGHYASSAEWDQLMRDPSVTVIDARNAYEIHLGSFERAIDPNTRSFTELPAFIKKTLDPKDHKKIATFCTGGIRCEKFSSWLLDQGFEEVYQLKGGILKYLEETPEAQSTFHGECYVFDERVAVGHGLAPSSTATMCKACGHALTEEDRKHPSYKEEKSCGFCASAYGRQ